MRKIVAAIISVAFLLGCSWSETRDTAPQLPVVTVHQAPVGGVSQTTSTTTSSTTSTTTSMPLEVVLSTVNFEALAQLQISQAREIYGACGEWYETAIAAGWPAADWPRLSRIMFRESRCTVTAWNGRVPAEQWQPNAGMGCPDAGLVQINCVHHDGFTQMGWQWPTDAFNPERNLAYAALLWDNGNGCKHWAWLDC